MPDGWSWCRLPEICEYIFAGGDRPGIFSKEENEECKIPIYSNGIDKDGLYGFTNKPIAKESSLTISARGTIGFTCVRKTTFVLIIRLITITPFIEFIDVNYLKSVFDSLFNFTEGSSIPQLTIPTIRQFLLPLPPLSEQKRIVAKIEELFALLDNIQNNIS